MKNNMLKLLMMLSAMILSAAMVFGAAGCSGKPAVTGASVTTTAAVTTATETTAETTAESTTETTTRELKMSIDELVKAVISASDCGFKLWPETDPTNKEYNEAVIEKEMKAAGILNHRVIAYYLEDLKHYENSISVVVDIFEFDMDSKEYKELSENKEFKKFTVLGNPKKNGEIEWYYDADEAVATAINKQYVMYIYAIKGNVDVEEEKAPFTISEAQKAYEAFKNLK